MGLTHALLGKIFNHTRHRAAYLRLLSVLCFIRGIRWYFAARFVGRRWAAQSRYRWCSTSGRSASFRQCQRPAAAAGGADWEEEDGYERWWLGDKPQTAASRVTSSTLSLNYSTWHFPVGCPLKNSLFGGNPLVRVIETRFFGRIGSEVRVSVSFQIFALRLGLPPGEFSLGINSGGNVCGGGLFPRIRLP